MRKRKTVDLRRWLADNGITATSAAKDLGISKQHMSNIVNGHSSPSLDLAVSIEKLTGGAVTVESWK